MAPLTLSPIIIDTGPLVVLIDKADPAHQPCVAIFRLLTVPPVTTWSRLTEALYLVGRLCCAAFGKLTKLANNRYAPGTPAGNWRNQAYAV